MVENGDVIKIGRSDNPTPTLLDPEHNIRVIRGAIKPMGGGIIPVLDTPQAVRIDELEVTDRNHGTRTMRNVTAIIGHAMRAGRNREQRFFNGQPVGRTAEAYSAYAKKNRLQPPGLMIACDKHGKTGRITLGNVPGDISSSVGEDVNVSNFTRDAHGRVHLKIALQKGNFLGLK